MTNIIIFFINHKYTLFFLTGILLDFNHKKEAVSKLNFETASQCKNKI
jgi:hypothetical protein